MAEGAVGFGHTMRVFALLDGVAAVVCGIHQLARKTRRHGVLAAVARRGDQPADRQRLRTFRTHFDRHLIGRTADAAAADFDARLHVVQRVMEHANGLALGALLDGFHGTIDDAFGDGLLAVQHDAVHELRQDDITELGVRQNFPLFGTTTTSHLEFPSKTSAYPEPVRGLLWLIWDAWRRTSNATACG